MVKSWVKNLIKPVYKLFRKYFPDSPVRSLSKGKPIKTAAKRLKLHDQLLFDAAVIALKQGDHLGSRFCLEKINDRNNAIVTELEVKIFRDSGDTTAEALSMIKLLEGQSHGAKELKQLRKLIKKQSGQIKNLNKKASRYRDSIEEVMKGFFEFGLQIKTIIDVGVATGTPGLTDFYPKAHLLMVDPVPQNEVFMQNIAQKHESASYFLCAAAAEPGTLELELSAGFSGSRLTKFTVESSSNDVIEVEARPISDLVVEASAEGPFLLKVDVEGAEMEVLRGSEPIFEQLEVLILETRVFRFGEAPELFEVLSYLDRFDFTVYDIIDRNYNDVHGFLKQFDLVLVKKDSRLRDKSCYPLAKTAAGKIVMDNIRDAKNRKFELLAEKQKSGFGKNE